MLGQKIRNYRLALGLSLSSFVQRAAQNGHGFSTAALSKIEKGILKPSPSTLSAIAKVLSVEPAVLLGESEFTVKHLGFRKKSTLKRTEQALLANYAESEIEKIVLLYDRLFPGKLKEKVFRHRRISTPEEAEIEAEVIREKWELGIYPVKNLAAVLEQNGFFLKPVRQPENFDGYSVLLEDEEHRIIIGLAIFNENQPGDRQRFSFSHELAHFLFYNEDDVLNEKLAHRFASAFLIPKAELKAAAGVKRSHVTLNELLELKQYFGVSIQALIFRMKELGIISDFYAKIWFKKISSLGFRKREPGVVEQEKPVFVSVLAQRALSEGYISAEEAFAAYGVEAAELPVWQSSFRKFLKLPADEQAKVLAKQAEESVAYYAKDDELREFREANLGEYVD